MNPPLDPMLLDPGEYEYEYEYDETETESFYLNLDLTSINGPIRPPRQRNDENQNDPIVEDQFQDVADDQLDGHSFAPLETNNSDTLSSERIQLLGLHTCNPIISYNNQTFSCAWADQIGTELIFAHPETIPDPNHILKPLRKGPAYELLAANNVKLIGRKATIVSSSNPGLVLDPTPDATDVNSISTDVDASPSHAPTSTAVPRRPQASTHQANFIQRLQAMKNAKGQSDTVRTAMTLRRNVNYADRLTAWARTEAQLAEIANLNRRAANGDEDALDILEHMLRACERAEEARINS
ncbi:uncharacterized protein N7483_009048 [Penicillium malachiteum]|uniref:uncharacterized protein n=1 Tax=Penicillium malachiteum TaxID=1324776 RepID=UPI002546BC4C|nr:uncharacterized protein N7483_009048 [Penicillium malachiteum]KAJ5721114.1 hypothetical protein N7483_009048 [Penicillium malachiteum]